MRKAASLNPAKAASKARRGSRLEPWFVHDLLALDRIDEALETVRRFSSSEPSRTDTVKRTVASGILFWMTGDVSAGLYAMESLIPFQKKNARWVLEARIWRASMLSEFSDFGSIRLLGSLLEETNRRSDSVLSELALTALLEAKNRFRQSIGAADIDAAKAIRDPGLRMFALRMAGVPDETLEAGDHILPLMPWRMPEAWFERWMPRLSGKRAETMASIFPYLPDAPRMRAMACATCDNRCCYDGVYATKEEEDRIRALRKKAPKYFTTVPVDFTEEGEWGFLFHGKRTKLRPHDYTKPDYPAHFGKTKCVLALPNGECAPQRAGADLGYHPWRFKPSICWKFPLIGLFNDNAMEKPHYFGEPDPHAYDDTQRGYLSFLPCAALDENGFSWKEVYRHELLHFLRHELPKQE
jgi:hypothetical protein